MSSTGHCVPSTTAAGRDGAGVSLSGKTGMSNVDSSEEEGEDGVSTWGQWSEDGEEDGDAAESGDGDGDGEEDGDGEDEEDDEDEEEDDEDEEEDDEEVSTCGQCNESEDDESDSVASESASVSIVSLSTHARCSEGDVESSEVSTVETEEGADDERDSAVDWTPSSEVSTGGMDDGSEDDGVRRTVGDMMTEDSTRVTGDALGEVAKIPSTSIFRSLSITSVSRSSLPITSVSRSSLPITSVSFCTVASLKTGVSSSRSRRSSFSIAKSLLL